jgi:hypothetical protein
MRAMSDLLKEVIASDYISAFLLVDVGPFENNEYIRSTTLPYDFMFNATTFHSDARIINTELPKLSSSVDKGSYRIIIGDPLFYFRETIERGITGVKIRVDAGFLNMSDVAVQGIAPNEPFDSADMVYTIYEGVLDSSLYSISPDSEIILTLEGSSPMGAIGLKRTLLTSRDWLRQRFPNDSSFDQVFVGSTNANLQWGKTPPGAE